MAKFRLPDGSDTEDEDKFFEEWDRYKDFFENLGFRTVGYGSGITLDNGNWGGCFTLPIYAADIIISAVSGGGANTTKE